MKNLLFLFVSVLVLNGCVVREDSGTWEGQVMVRDESPYPHYCNVRVYIHHTDEDIEFREVYNSCHLYQSQWWPALYEVRGTTIWSGGEVVGWSRSDGSAGLAQNHDDYTSFPAVKRRVEISWTKDGDGLNFVEEYTVDKKRRLTTGYLRKERT